MVKVHRKYTIEISEYSTDDIYIYINSKYRELQLQPRTFKRLKLVKFSAKK